jgi:hypothetical protein
MVHIPAFGRENLFIVPYFGYSLENGKNFFVYCMFCRFFIFKISMHPNCVRKSRLYRDLDRVHFYLKLGPMLWFSWYTKQPIPFLYVPSVCKEMRAGSQRKKKKKKKNYCITFHKGKTNMPALFFL